MDTTNYDGLICPVNIVESIKSARERADEYARQNGKSEEWIQDQWKETCHRLNGQPLPLLREAGRFTFTYADFENGINGIYGN